MIIHDMQQGSDEWFDVRLGRVTASCFAIATADGRGGSPSSTRKTYMYKLLAERMTGEPQEGYSNAVMARGGEVEPLARKYYEQLNSVSVQQIGFVERDEDTGASPDGFVGKGGMIEIKCPDSSTHIATLVSGKMPTGHFKQVQGGLWVCERDWCDFISYDPRVRQRPYFCHRIYREEKAIKELHIKIIMFVDEMKSILDKLTKFATVF